LIVSKKELKNNLIVQCLSKTKELSLFERQVLVQTFEFARGLFWSSLRDCLQYQIEWKLLRLEMSRLKNIRIE